MTKDEVISQIHAGRRSKLRALLSEHGLDTFNQTQVLEYLLDIVLPRQDTHPTAHRLMGTYGSLDAVLAAHPTKLQQTPGVGENIAVFLNFCHQLVPYMAKIKRQREQIRTPHDAIAVLGPIMKIYPKEHFHMMCLDKSGTILLEQNLAGSGDRVHVNMRELIDTILRDQKTTQIILAHNHPSDNPSPSDADIQLTRQIINLITPLEITMMDHIIFTPSGQCTSFSKRGWLDILRREHDAFTLNRDWEDLF